MTLGFRVFLLGGAQKGSQGMGLPACSRGSHLALGSKGSHCSKDISISLEFHFLVLSSHRISKQTPCSAQGLCHGWELPGAFGVGSVELRGNRNLINCEALGKTKLFLLPSTALWPPGREPPWLQSKPRAGRGVLGPAEQGWGSLGTLLCCCVPCCPSLGGLTPEHPVGDCREPQLETGAGGNWELSPSMLLPAATQSSAQTPKLCSSS